MAGAAANSGSYGRGYPASQAGRCRDWGARESLEGDLINEVAGVDSGLAFWLRKGPERALSAITDL